MKTQRLLRAILTFALLLFSGAPVSATIEYSVSLARPEQHLFRVSIRVADVKDSVTFQMPAWNATYQIRDFAHRVQGVKVTATGGPVHVEKSDKQTWHVTLAKGAKSALQSVTFEYAILWDDLGPFSSQLDASHAFINPATVLMYVPERRSEDVRIRLADLPESWKIAVALKPGADSASFRAANYDALADAPFEVGRYEEQGMEVGGKPIRVVVHGTEWNRAALTDAVRRVVTYQLRLMEGAPFDEYIFIYHFGIGGGGGMEHANSTAISLGANGSPAGVTAHEFFHLWNVKRIRPRTLEPVDYTRENWTRALWFAEGVTSTYGSFTLVRSGLWSREQFYEELAAEINELESRPARLWQSAEQASLDAWLEKYPLYRRPESSISYYNKGQILGVLLDIQIRQATHNSRSLDDVMRYLNREFAQRGRFYNDSADIRAAVEKVAGRDFGQFLERYVAGTDELPCRDMLALAGLELIPREEERPDFGFSVSRAPGTGSSVVEVRPGGQAEIAGIRAGDLLVTLNGEPFPNNAGRWLRDHRAGEAIRLGIRRGGEEREIMLKLGARGERRYVLRELPNSTEQQRRIREGLLAGTTD